MSSEAASPQEQRSSLFSLRLCASARAKLSLLFLSDFTASA